MKDIIATGHISADNGYPVVHVLGVNLLYLTGLNIEEVVNLLFISFSIIFVLNISLLAKALAKHNGQFLLMTAFAFPLIFSAFQAVIHPAMFSIFMVPALLYCYHKSEQVASNRVSYTILLLLYMLAITYSHPITCLFVIVALFTIAISRFIYRRFVSNRIAVSKHETDFTSRYGIPLLMFCVFFVWYIEFAGIQGDIKRVYNFIMFGSSTPSFDTQMGILSMAHLSVLQIFELFFYRYGPIFIYGILGTVSAFILFKLCLAKNKRPDSNGFVYASLFVIAVAMTAFSLFGFTGETEPERISRFFLFVSPITIGLAIHKATFKNVQTHMVNKYHLRENLLFSLTSAILIFVATFCVLNVYGSQRTAMANGQITKMEIDGTTWFSTHQDGVTITASTGLTLVRFEDFNFGVESDPLARAILGPILIPTNFGYPANPTMADTYKQQNRYLLTDEASRLAINIFPENSRDNIHHYSDSSFTTLNDDPTVIKIYSNPEFEVWRVNG